MLGRAYPGELYYLGSLLDSGMRRDGCTGEIYVEITQEELAEAAGLSRETVGKYLHVLQEQGILRVDRGRVFITDPSQLSGLR